jgi:hypothetical protein
MSLTEPQESKWVPWFWLSVIVLTVGSIAAGAAYLVYALWKGL